MRSKSRQLDELLPRFPQQSAHCCHSMYNLYRPAALGKGGSITQGSHHRPIRSGQEREEEEEKEEEEEEEEEKEEEEKEEEEEEKEEEEKVERGKKFGDLIYLS